MEAEDLERLPGPEEEPVRVRERGMGLVGLGVRHAEDLRLRVIDDHSSGFCPSHNPPEEIL